MPTLVGGVYSRSTHPVRLGDRAYQQFSPTTFRIKATVDVDCDGIYGEWRVDGSVDASGEVVGWDTLVHLPGD